MTHPRALPQRAESPSTRDSYRDHQMKPGKRPHPETHEREAIFKKMPVARGALLDLLFQKNTLLEALKRPGEVAAWPQKKDAAHHQQPQLTRRNTNAVRLVDTLEICGLLCVCTRSPFIPAPRGGVRVAKHARQLSLACFVNTRRWLGSRARSH